jgi:hypothetical protein
VYRLIEPSAAMVVSKRGPEYVALPPIDVTEPNTDTGLSRDSRMFESKIILWLAFVENSH